MFKLFLISVLTAFAFVCTSFAQSVYTPEKGSTERKAILDALRIPVEKELKQKVVFSTESFNVYGNWAFLGGTPQNPGGDSPNYRGTPYQRAKDSGMFDNNFFALLRKTGRSWRVVKYAIGCTDVCYADWWQRHRAPKAVFPYTE